MNETKQSYAMRMARADEKDIEAVQKFWERLEDWVIAGERIEAGWLDQAIDTVEGSFNRVFFGYQVLHDNACDKSLDYLDYKPWIKNLETVAENNLKILKALYDTPTESGVFNSLEYQLLEQALADTEAAIAAAKGEVSA